ncbi:MAG: pilus assembly protein [Deltaproteobacteria bacterium]|nr:pilus assembly protein [Deltaproteobacteria bacterium]MBW2254628.1 pilus assembly protein [Deltaproteobacteria bacterium]
MRSRSQRPGPRGRGAALLEFTLSLPILLFLLGGIFDLGFYLQAYADVQSAVRDACRSASTVTDADIPADGLEIEEAARGQTLAFLEASGLHCGDGCTVLADWFYDEPLDYWMLSVNVHYPHTPILGVLPALRNGINAQFSTVTVEQN